VTIPAVADPAMAIITVHVPVEGVPVMAVSLYTYCTEGPFVEFPVVTMSSHWLSLMYPLSLF
jgi:hypothetical protein